jgi:hypothetical protein
MFWLNELHVNYKSHVFQPTIIMYHIKVFTTLNFFCAWCYLGLQALDSIEFAFIFSFNNYIFRFNNVLNNMSFIFWKMNIKL